MKKLLYLGIILMLASCGSNGTVNYNGREVSTVKVGNLEVMTEDLGHMNWDDATKACADLGEGWRLPTKDELNVLYENKDEIGGYSPRTYWSSTTAPHMKKFVWTQHFQTGRLTEGGKRSSHKRNARAVKRLTKDRICEICDFKIKDDEKWEEMGEGYYWHMKCFEEQMQSGQ
jgi:hypothetical protein